MSIVGVTNKKAAMVSAPPRRRARKIADSDNPPPMTMEQALRSREFAKKVHRAIVARGYTEADLRRIVKEVRAELRSKKSS